MQRLTRLMLTIRDAQEAAIAAAIGFDDIEWKVPGGTAFDPAAGRAIRAAFPGRFRLRFEDDGVGSAAAGAVSVGADEAAWPANVWGAPAVPVGLAAVAVITDVDGCNDYRLQRDGGASAFMLDTSPRRLVEAGGAARLDAFSTACRGVGKPFGFAGALEAPDVARLLLLDPDVLCFDAAVRAHHDPADALDVDALRAIRALIPRGEATAPIPGRPALIDTLFVRDFVVPLSIGAYKAEHGKRQRVRFSVDASVRREPASPRDMRDVFSYDVIIETIRVLSDRGHVVFVETLAEEIAASLLAHRALVGVTIKVEKLDVIDGSVGIVIQRTAGDRR